MPGPSVRSSRASGSNRSAENHPVRSLASRRVELPCGSRSRKATRLPPCSERYQARWVARKVLPTPPLSRLTTIVFMSAGPLRLIVVGYMQQIASIIVSRHPSAPSLYTYPDLPKQQNSYREPTEN